MKVLNSGRDKEAFMIYRWTVFLRNMVIRYCNVWARETWKTNISIMLNGLVHQDGLVWWGDLDVSDHLVTFKFVAKKKKAFVEIVL